MKRLKPLTANREHDWSEPDEDGFRTCQNNGCGTRWWWLASPNDPPGHVCYGGLSRGRPKQVSDRRDEKRPDLGTALQEYVEGLACLLAGDPDHTCKGDVVAHHVVHKNHAGDWLERGGRKVGNLTPLCSVGGHQDGPESVHVLGRDTFEARFDLDLAAEAERIGERYREAG